MNLPRLALAIVVAACVAAAGTKPAKPAPKFESVTSTHVDFPAGGTLRIERSTGALSIEGWDGAGMEMTVTEGPPLAYDGEGNRKPAGDRSLDEVRIVAAREGNQVVVHTVAPRIPHVWVSTRIRVPRNASLVVDRQGGEVNVADVAGNLQLTTRRGEISLLLPADRQYAIDARAQVGDIYSDYPGAERRRLWLVGHRFAPENAARGRRLYLRTGYGDIIIQKIRQGSDPLR